MRRKKHLAGSVTIEASLALAFFIFGYLAVLSLVYVVRTESMVQYGINRTASEIARYSYTAERLSLTQYVTQAGMTAGELIDSIGGFSNLSGGTTTGDNAGSNLAEMANQLTGNASISGFAGDPLFRSVFAGCVAGSKAEADQYFKNLAGITTDDIDFHYSSVLRDGKTVEIVAVYKVKLKTYGLFGKNGLSLTMKNTACAGAWLAGNKKSQQQQGQNISSAPSKWSLSAFKRGQAWVSEIKSEHSKAAVKGGKGIDICENGTYTMIGSVNIFMQSYSDCSKEGSSDPADYSIKEAAFSKAVSGYASQLKKSVKEKRGELQFENGTAVPDQGKNAKLALIIVVPAEGAASASAKDVLDKTAAKMKKNGVEVHYEFRESAFYTETTNP